MPDSALMASMLEDGGEGGDDDDVDSSLDNLEEVAADRRRSRSFFDQSDIANGLNSSKPPAVTAGRKDSSGEKFKFPERTGKGSFRRFGCFSCSPLFLLANTAQPFFF